MCFILSTSCAHKQSSGGHAVLSHHHMFHCKLSQWFKVSENGKCFSNFLVYSALNKNQLVSPHEVCALTTEICFKHQSRCPKNIDIANTQLIHLPSWYKCIPELMYVNQLCNQSKILGAPIASVLFQNHTEEQAMKANSMAFEPGTSIEAQR